MSALILVIDRHKQASRVSSAILFRVLLFIFISHSFFVQSLLSGETALCLQASKMCRSAHYFLTKENDPIAIYVHNFCKRSDD